MPVNTKPNASTLYEIAHGSGHEAGAITYGIHHGATKDKPMGGANSARYRQYMADDHKRREEWFRQLELYVLERIKAIDFVNGKEFSQND